MLKKISLLLFIILNIFLLLYDNNRKKVVEKTNIKLLDNYYKKNSDEYIGVISIPIINLKRGFYKIDHKLNNVKYNIELINDDLNNIILAAHSGTGDNAYFNDVLNLRINDIIYLDFSGYYTYQITNIYEVEKNGYIDLIKDSKDKTLTLITCSKKDKTKQTVIISKLI